jgi:hypothetical protein
MKYVRRLILRENLRNALAISQIALLEAEILQSRERIRFALETRSDNVPTLSL